MRLEQGAVTIHSRLTTAVNYLDRNNIAAARLKGLQEDLSLSDTEYSTCLSILYVGYILMQVPSNMIVNKIQRPSWYIGAAILLWGMISTLSGNVHNFTGMVLVRFFLGFVEAAFLREYSPLYVSCLILTFMQLAPYSSNRSGTHAVS